MNVLSKKIVGNNKIFKNTIAIATEYAKYLKLNRVITFKDTVISCEYNVNNGTEVQTTEESLNIYIKAKEILANEFTEMEDIYNQIKCIYYNVNNKNMLILLNNKLTTNALYVDREKTERIDIKKTHGSGAMTKTVRMLVDREGDLIVDNRVELSENTKNKLKGKNIYNLDTTTLLPIYNREILTEWIEGLQKRKVNKILYTTNTRKVYCLNIDREVEDVVQDCLSLGLKGRTKINKSSHFRKIKTIDDIIRFYRNADNVYEGKIENESLKVKQFKLLATSESKRGQKTKVGNYRINIPYNKKLQLGEKEISIYDIETIIPVVEVDITSTR